MTRTWHAVVCAAFVAAFAPDTQSASQQSASRPVLQNCGVPLSVERPPARVVTLNQAATEVMLALGLQDRMVGTAYLDDEILPEFRTAYRRIPVLSLEYPSREVLIATKPDFLYAAYASAFAPEGVGSRDEWRRRSVETYLSPAACVDKTVGPGVTFETTFEELRQIARTFDVSDRADRLIASYRAELADISKRIQGVSPAPRVFWYDAGDPPRVAACCGAPNYIMKAVGAVNIFGDTPGAWSPVSWETVIARDPDAIVLANAAWSTAADKRKQLAARRALNRITAMKTNRLIEIDFAFSTPGIRNVAAARTLAAALYPNRFR